MRFFLERLAWCAGLVAILAGAPGCVFHPGGAPLPEAVTDLPLVVYPPPERGSSNTGSAAADTLVVMLSGDGGWAGLDKSVGHALARAGYGVVGWDSLRYYWHAHAPDDAAADLDRVIETYRARWHRRRVVLIGYSRGADVMPFVYNRLPPATRAQVAHIVLLGLARHITFGYHLLWWIGLGPEGRAIMPEARRLPPERTSCLYGVDDPHASCGALAAAGFDVLGLPGGHHFDRKYAHLAELIRQRIAEAK
ncbi:AcvB/VirJ family lysyl-phosphatidylglycerol hydrolase [Salinisphaera sp. LB1]|uniref:AcvB/VirJ family lysyl-phosphatidylglycerol hydrolase n=1 Tax=Salinisphaera sp. LB1 TaxID=2183911 RepID=UPI000D7E3FD4|nr:AcvB/VirJ family lysyl-phosphatidylglycerol hydrolase [Salinisphaera sp. LB1]AWN15937.1 virulence protein [Salinisphaera sp. LB1]